MAKAIKTAEQMYFTEHNVYTADLEELSVGIDGCASISAVRYDCNKDVRISFHDGNTVYVFINQLETLGVNFTFATGSRKCYGKTKGDADVCKSMGGVLSLAAGEGGWFNLP